MMEENMNPENVDWGAIAEETGYTPQQIAAIRKQWKPREQKLEEVREGVLWERERRLDRATEIVAEAKKL